MLFHTLPTKKHNKDTEDHSYTVRRRRKTLQTCLRGQQTLPYSLIVELLCQSNHTVSQTRILDPKFRGEWTAAEGDGPGRTTWGENEPLGPFRERLLDDFGLLLEARLLRAADYESLVARLGADICGFNVSEGKVPNVYPAGRTKSRKGRGCDAKDHVPVGLNRSIEG